MPVDPANLGPAAIEFPNPANGAQPAFGRDGDDDVSTEYSVLALV